MTNSIKHNRPYRLEPYNPRWAEDYEKKRKTLETIFGSELVTIDHIGSTSIPGMVAKPQIDILLIVKDLLKVKGLYPAMKEAGFTAMSTENRTHTISGDEYFTENLIDGTRLTSVHVFEKGQSKTAKYLRFRDYLRSHKEEREIYTSQQKNPRARSILEIIQPTMPAKIKY